jgi:hypothetical protein
LVGEKLSTRRWSPKRTRFGGFLVTGRGYGDDERVDGKWWSVNGGWVRRGLTLVK